MATNPTPTRDDFEALLNEQLGGAGDDVLEGDEGNDEIRGGDGDDNAGFVSL